MADAHEEEVLGKAYDSRLMKRLLTYLRPYKWQVMLALTAIVLKAVADVLGPYLTKVAVDKYLAHAPRSTSFLDRILSSQPLIGIAQIAGFTSVCLHSASCSSSPRPTSCSGPGRRSCSTCGPRFFATCSACTWPFLIATRSAAWSRGSLPMWTR